jgi:hypothetical protein
MKGLIMMSVIPESNRAHYVFVMIEFLHFLSKFFYEKPLKKMGSILLTWELRLENQ